MDKMNMNNNVKIEIVCKNVKLHEIVGTILFYYIVLTVHSYYLYYVYKMCSKFNGN